MAGFTVRIELEGASQGDYALLHRRMEAAGYRRSVTVSQPLDGERYRFTLPKADYVLDCATEASQVRDHAKSIADTVTTGGRCLVLWPGASVGCEAA